MNSKYAVLWGIVLSNGAAILLLLLAYLLTDRFSGAATFFIASAFVIVPMLMGAICAWFWRGAKLSRAAYLGYSFLETGVALGLSYLFLREGIICILMASPVVLLFVYIGVQIGKYLYDEQHRTLKVSFAPTCLALLCIDSLSPHHFTNTETDRIVIRACPERVWQYIVDYPAMTDKADWWLFRIGLPAPVQSTSEGHYVSAARHCLFRYQSSRTIGFDEKITELVPARKLTFDVTTQPNDPEIIGHFALKRGQFILHDNGDGTTTLTGTTWYALNVYPACYYDLWVQDIIRQVHLRVMRHIQALAERPE